MSSTVEAPPKYEARLKADGRWYWCRLSEMGWWYQVGACAFKCGGHVDAEGARRHWEEWKEKNGWRADPES